QVALKSLDYYQGEATGEFDQATQKAVADFQADQGLEPTGSFDLATYDALENQTRRAGREAKQAAQQQAARHRKFALVGVAGIIGLAGLAGGAYILLRFVNRTPTEADGWLDDDEEGVEEDVTDEIEQFVEPVTPLPPEPLPPRQPLKLTPIATLQPIDPPKFETIATIEDTPPQPTSASSPPPPLTQDVWTETEPKDTLPSAKHALAAPPPAAPPVGQNGQAAHQALTVRPAPEPLPKTDVIEELIRELQSPSPEVRRQAIWELAQKADSRAVQPLVNLLLDSDSQQQSLVLEALSQIGVRTLKPINRALALSLQDENAQVRKNAIRDVSRIYALLSQLSQLIYYATDDPDADVQETAQWALEQLKKIRVPHPGES
ncbi:MAG: hypothetical protein F6J87_23460, partial [Spirulina sp. SIO3F2]|nr:hypothetical protein [Spirulina sp. SIO3F2]